MSLSSQQSIPGLHDSLPPVLVDLCYQYFEPEVIAFLLQHVPTARTVIIRGCRDALCDFSLSTVLMSEDELANFAGLRSLNLSGCTQITDAGLVHVKGVSTLNLTGCTQISDAGCM